MKTIIMGMLLGLLASCSTNPIKQAAVAQQEIVEDTIKEDKMFGGSLPSWVRRSGIETGMVYTVGKAEFDANKSPFYVEKAAQMDAESRLISDAPTDFRILTQNAMTGAGIDSAEFYQIQTKLQQVVGLTGIKVDQDKITCRKFIRYGNLSTRVTRACFVQAFIPVKELMKAYQRTLALKFGDYKAGEFKNLMQQELERVTDNPLMEKRNEKVNSPRVRVRKLQRNEQRLPAQQVKAPKKKSEVFTKDSQGSKLPRGRKQIENANAGSRIPSAVKKQRSKNPYGEKLSRAQDIAKDIVSKRGSLAEVQLPAQR